MMVCMHAVVMVASTQQGLNTFVSAVSLPTGVTAVQANILQLCDQFESLRTEELEKAQVRVESLLNKLYDLPAAVRDQHRDFLMKYEKYLDECYNIRCVFRKLNTYWNYLNMDILAHLITTFSIQSLYTQLEAYEERLQHFMEWTTLKEYYAVEADKQKPKVPKEFIDLVSVHSWKPPVYLKKVDEFRRELAREYGLHACAVILVSMDIGSVVITMMVPESVVAMVNSTGTEFFKEHGIVHLQLNGTCVYPQASRPASGTCSNNNDIICCVFPDSLAAHTTCRLKMKCLPQQCSLLLRGSLSSSKELLPQSQWLRQLVGRVSGRVMQLSQVPCSSIAAQVAMPL